MKREVTQTIQIPESTGVEGFLLALRSVIQRPRVQRVVIDSSGRVTYTRLAEEEEEENPNIGVDFGELEPYGVIRNATVRELDYPRNLGACDVVAAMFDAVTAEGYTSICFASGMETELWTWCYLSSGVDLRSHNRFFGYPIYLDRNIPNSALVLCAGVGQTSALIDTRLAVKIEMQQNRVLNDDLEIL